jgi:hypothetical protein
MTSRKSNCSSIVSSCRGSFLFRSECVPWHPCHLLLRAYIIVRIDKLGGFVLIFLLLLRLLFCSHLHGLRRSDWVRSGGLSCFCFSGGSGDEIIKRGRIRRLLRNGFWLRGCRLWFLLNARLKCILFLEGLVDRRWIWETWRNLTLMHLLHLESVDLRRTESWPLGQAGGSWQTGRSWRKASRLRRRVHSWRHIVLLLERLHR